MNSNASAPGPRMRQCDKWGIYRSSVSLKSTSIFSFSVLADTTPVCHCLYSHRPLVWLLGLCMILYIRTLHRRPLCLTTSLTTTPLTTSSST